MLVRPDVRVSIVTDVERAYGVPVAGTWSAATGTVVAPGAGRVSMFQAESITASVSAAFCCGVWRMPP
jgi:hypothetical protein